MPKTCPHCGEKHQHFCSNFRCQYNTEECFECHEEIRHSWKPGMSHFLEAIASIMESNVALGSDKVATEDIRYLSKAPPAVYIYNPGVGNLPSENDVQKYLHGENERLSEFFD